MKVTVKFIAVLLAASFAFGLASCATTPNEEAVEVQPSAEEMERQRQEEMERQRQEELARMRQQELEAETEPAAVDLSTVLETVYFDYDKYTLKQATRESLSRNAEWLKANSSIQLQIEGHCDERGTEEYNLALGERRSSSVKNYLVSLGVDENRLYTISYGEEMPVDPGHSGDSWTQNRRAEFKITNQ
ncbi:MAG: hypothetical protein IEMM0002_0393 [bacterium]|nr:MAG: hypothetical protein IEMM0002_0393 [bacterium]